MGRTSSKTTSPGIFAAHMARHPEREAAWAVERIRLSAEADDLTDAEARQEVLAVLDGMDLAVKRRQEAR